MGVNHADINKDDIWYSMPIPAKPLGSEIVRLVVVYPGSGVGVSVIMPTPPDGTAWRCIEKITTRPNPIGVFELVEKPE